MGGSIGYEVIGSSTPSGQFVREGQRVRSILVDAVEILSIFILEYIAKVHG